MRPDAPASSRLLALALACLVLACGETGKTTAPEIRLSDDRLYLPVPEVRRSVELNSASEAARAAKQEITVQLNIARLVLSRLDTPVRRVRNIAWTWQSDGCSWQRQDAGPCRQVITACDRETRVDWTLTQSGLCGEPPREIQAAVSVQGWSAPYGSAGNLFTCLRGDVSAVADRAEWSLVPGSRLVRWKLQQTEAGGGDLLVNLSTRVAADGADAYEFELPDSLRWVGVFGSGGTSGDLKVYAWRPARGGWVSREDVLWSPAGGSWTRYGDTGEPETRTWESSRLAVRS